MLNCRALQIASQSQVIEWDTTKNLVDYPYNIKKIYFKEASKNRKNFTNWVNKKYVKDLIKI